MIKRKEIPRALLEIRDLVDAGRPIIYIQTPEEERVALLLREAATALFNSPPPLYSWTETEGLRTADGSTVVAAAAGARAAIDFAVEHEGPALFHFLDLHGPMRESD